MLSMPQSRGVLRTYNASGRLTSTFGTNVAAGGTAHTLSASFVVLFAATTYDTHWITIIPHNTASSATRTDSLLNLYIGSAGNEVVFIPNLLTGWCGSFGGFVEGRAYRFPVYIPAGSRITAKSQALIVSDAVYVWVVLECCTGLLPNCGRAVEALGINTGSSIGTSVTGGTTSEGTFVDIGTTTRDWKFVTPGVQGTLADTVMADESLHLDIGVGGSAYRGLDDFQFFKTFQEKSYQEFPGRYCQMPTGTALQLRSQSAGTTPEATDMALYGVY